MGEVVSNGVHKSHIYTALQIDCITLLAGLKCKNTHLEFDGVRQKAILLDSSLDNEKITNRMPAEVVTLENEDSLKITTVENCFSFSRVLSFQSVYLSKTKECDFEKMEHPFCYFFADFLQSKERLLAKEKFPLVFNCSGIMF